MIESRTAEAPSVSAAAEGGGRAEEAYQLLDEDKMSHLVTPDDSPIGSVFVQMAAFSYDRARELASNASASAATTDRELCQIMSWVSSLCQAEKLYSSLNFLINTRTSIFRKENALKASYGNLLTEINKIVDVGEQQLQQTPIQSPSSRRTSGGSSVADGVPVGGCPPPYSLSLARDLKTFVTTRMELMEVHEQLATRGSERVEATAPATKLKADPQAADGGLGAMLDTMMMPYETLLGAVGRVKQNSYSKLRLGRSGPQAPVGTGPKNSLGKLGEALFWEIELIESLLSSLHLMNRWRYWETLVQLTRAKDKIESWEQCRRLRQEASPQHGKSLLDTIFGSGWTNSTPATPTDNRSNPSDVDSRPPLYQWLTSLKDAALSKFTLYFYETLEKQSASSAQMRDMCDTKMPIKYLKQIEALQSDCEVPILMIIYDATNDDEFRGAGVGFQCLEKISKPMTDPNGLVPPIFTSSMTVDASHETGDDEERREEREFQIGIRPGVVKLHWPPVLRALQDERGNLACPNTVVHFYDPQVKYTYYMSRIDPQMTILGVYEVKKGGKCPKLTERMLQLAESLRCCRVFASLKYQSAR